MEDSVTGAAVGAWVGTAGSVGGTSEAVVDSGPAEEGELTSTKVVVDSVGGTFGADVAVTRLSPVTTSIDVLDTVDVVVSMTGDALGSVTIGAVVSPLGVGPLVVEGACSVGETIEVVVVSIIPVG